MKWLVAFVLIIFIYSCINEKEYNNTNNKSEKLSETQPIDSTGINFFEETYLRFNYISKTAEDAITVEPNKECLGPLKDLIYNKVIAFDFYGTHERYCIFDKARFSSDNYRNNAYEMKILNQDQVNLISNLITNPMTYGQSTAACFDPSMAFIFFDETKIVLEVDICLDCNFLVINSPEEFSLEVDYQKFEEYEDSETGESYRYYLVGFSEEGISGIVSLAKELKMNYSDYKKHNE